MQENMKVKVIVIDSCTACITFCTEKPSTIFTHTTTTTVNDSNSHPVQSQSMLTRTRQSYFGYSLKREGLSNNESAFITCWRSPHSNGEKHWWPVRKSKGTQEQIRSIPIASLEQHRIFFPRWIQKFPLKVSSEITMVLHFSPGKSFLASKVEDFFFFFLPALEEVLVLLGDNDIQLIIHHPFFFFFTFCMRFFSRYCGKNMARKLASKWFIPASICNCVNTSCTSGSTSEWDSLCRGSGARDWQCFSAFWRSYITLGQKTERWTHYSENIAFDNAHLFW